MSACETRGQEPYAVKTVLKENSAVDPDTGTGIYVRYTELIAADDAPERFRNAVAECSRRAREAAQRRMRSVSAELTAEKLQNKTRDYSFACYASIVTVTRADHAAFSILETEYEAGLWDSCKGHRVSYRFRGSTFDTTSGKEILLSELIPDSNALSKRLEKALETQYGTTGLAGTKPSDCSWTADALGIRFYFNSDAVSVQKCEEIGNACKNAVTIAFPYDTLDGAAVGKLSEAPEDYIARIDRETVYDLPHGDLSVMMTKNGAETVIRMMPDRGKEDSLIIEYADNASVFYIIRSRGGFYLFRENADAREGFFYDFLKPYVGSGRFGYDTSQYFDSFTGEIGLALPYNPSCVHMGEEKRSFGKGASFVPNAHYSFTEERGYKRFVPIDGILQIDTRNTALRLLDDMPAVELDPQGGELREITIKGGSALFFESVSGEAGRYRIPPLRASTYDNFIYCYRLADGRRVRISSENKKSLTRFSEPVSLAEARIDIIPPEPEVFSVRIGNKDYPVIPDYTRPDHCGEEIDFGDDIWWKAEGYVGVYETDDEDFSKMTGSMPDGKSKSSEENKTVLIIRKDGRVRFEDRGEVYEGRMPDKRYYQKDVIVDLGSPSEWRSFTLFLRDGVLHDAPTKILFHSRARPATNVPSTQGPINAYLIKTGTDIPEQYDFSGEAESVQRSKAPAEEGICPFCGGKSGNTRFCLECGAPLRKS